MLDMIINLAIFLCTLLAYAKCFRKDGKWNAKGGVEALRYFTILSNLFCAIASLITAISIAAGHVEQWVWLLKYVGTAAVTVTFLTVMFFLGPSAGYKALLSGWDLYLHMIGPLLAIVSFCFFERFYPLSLKMCLIGVIPVILYGAFYLYKVVVCEPERRWDDFYGYNKSGKWPISFAAMVLGGVVICLALRFLYSL